MNSLCKVTLPVKITRTCSSRETYPFQFAAASHFSDHSPHSPTSKFMAGAPLLSAPSNQITKMPLTLSTLSNPRNPLSFPQQSGINRFYPNFCLSVKMTTKPLARATSVQRSYQLREGQKRHFHQLPSGLKMEVIEQKPPAHVADMWKGAPPLVFVHGSFHAAWCWAEHWMPFFSSSGLRCYAISVLGQVLSVLVLDNFMICTTTMVLDTCFYF